MKVFYFGAPRTESGNQNFNKIVKYLINKAVSYTHLSKGSYLSGEPVKLCLFLEETKVKTKTTIQGNKWSTTIWLN